MITAIKILLFANGITIVILARLCYRIFIIDFIDNEILEHKNSQQ